MYKSQRIEEYEGFGTFCHRVGIPAVEEFIKTYEPGSWRTLPDPFVLRDARGAEEKKHA